jgi:hypothetical protein
VSHFVDVEAFARQHANCGGMTPTTGSPVGGGYLLTLTCACGATFDRWVSPDEAEQPMPSRARPSTDSPSEARRVPAPSRELEDAMREALAAESASPVSAPKRPPPPPPSTSSDDLQEVLRQALEAETAAPLSPPPPKPAPPPPKAAPPPATGDSQSARKRAADRATPPARPTPPRRTGGPSKNLEEAMRQALAAQSTSVTAASARPPATRFWFGVIAAATLLVIGGAWYVLQEGGDSGPTETVSVTTPVGAPTAMTQTDHAAFTEMLQSLRQLQAATTPATPYATYSSRVLFAKSDLDRFMKSNAPLAVRNAVRDTLDVHALAAAAWRARSMRLPELYEAIGQDPTIEACPSVKRLADAAEQPSSQTRAHARGIAVSNAVPTIWECAAEKFAAVEKVRSAP